MHNLLLQYRIGSKRPDEESDDVGDGSIIMPLRENLTKQAALLRATFVNRVEGGTKYSVEDANKKLRETELQWNYTSTSKSYSWA